MIKSKFLFITCQLRPSNTSGRRQNRFFSQQTSISQLHVVYLPTVDSLSRIAHSSIHNIIHVFKKYYRVEFDKCKYM